MNSLVFTTCLVISGLVSVCFVIYYATKNPNPHFRPKKGEIVMMSIFLAIISGFTSFTFSQFFEADLNLKKIAEQEERRQQEKIRASSDDKPSESTSSEVNQNPEASAGMGSSVNGSSNRPPIPPFLEEK